MDEIDAALDFKNVSIVACYIYVSMDKCRSGGFEIFVSEVWKMFNFNRYVFQGEEYAGI